MGKRDQRPSLGRGFVSRGLCGLPGAKYRQCHRQSLVQLINIYFSYMYITKESTVFQPKTNEFMQNFNSIPNRTI